MKHNISCQWKGDMAFETEVTGHKIRMDAAPDFGGKDSGPRPKPLLLAALAGCTGMDVASLLKKMRVEVESFSIDVDADMTEEHPKYYNNIEVVYIFKGKNLDKNKIEKAVKLSQERYCGVSYILRQAANVSYKIKYIE